MMVNVQWSTDDPYLVYVLSISLAMLLQEEKDKIIIAAKKDDVQTLQELTSKGVDVKGIVNDRVSMCVTIP